MRNAFGWTAALFGPLLVVGACVGDAPEFPIDDAGADAGHDATTADAGVRAEAGAGADADRDVDAGAVADAGAEPDADGAAQPDAQSDAPTGSCDPTAPFLHITNVSELNGPKDDESARLTADERTVYFTSRSGGGTGPSEGGFIVEKATRPDRGAAFGGIDQVPLAIDSSGPSVTGDGLLLYYANSIDSGPPDLRVTTFPFNEGNSRLLAAINSTAWEFTPNVRSDNLELYFASTRTTNDDIFVTALANGAFAGVAAIDAINTVNSERTPVISADGLTLYFGSNRGGDYEIYVVRRASLGVAFQGPPVQVTELGTTSLELPDWLSPDSCSLYFRSDRPGGLGGRDIYKASRR